MLSERPIDRLELLDHFFDLRILMRRLGGFDHDVEHGASRVCRVGDFGPVEARYGSWTVASDPVQGPMARQNFV